MSIGKIWVYRKKDLLFMGDFQIEYVLRGGYGREEKIPL